VPTYSRSRVPSATATSLASTGDAATTALTSVDQICLRPATFAGPSAVSLGLYAVRCVSKPYVGQSTFAGSVVDVDDDVVMVAVVVVVVGGRQRVASASSRQAARIGERHTRRQR